MSEYLDGSQRDRSGPARRDAGDLADVSDEDLMPDRRVSEEVEQRTALRRLNPGIIGRSADSSGPRRYMERRCHLTDRRDARYVPHELDAQGQRANSGSSTYRPFSTALAVQLVEKAS